MGFRFTRVSDLGILKNDECDLWPDLLVISERDRHRYPFSGLRHIYFIVIEHTELRIALHTEAV